MRVTGNKRINTYRLSIRVSTDGFSLYIYKEGDSKPFEKQQVPVSPGDYPHIALERALTRERLMELQYDEVEMIVDAPTTRIPLEEFQREETEAIFYLTYPRLKQASVKVCYEILPYLEVVELFAVDSLLLNMVMQLFPEVQLHSWQGRILESTAKSEQKDASVCRRMHVCRNSSGIFIYVLKKKGLHFACTYEVDNPTDALYFVLFTWKKLDFNAHEDLCILHDYEELADELGKYLKNLKTCE